MKLTIGADPELFIKDNKTGKLISAAGLFPGTKEAPHPVMHGAIQVDGMAAEYNILPTSTAEEFVFNHISVLRSLRDSIKENNPELDFSFEFNPVAEFGAEYIAQQSEVARALGCTPDYNAYENGEPNPTPDAEMPFRTASGHIHLGWTKDQDINDPEHIEACCMMTKQLDCYAGIYMMELEGEDGLKRRQLYGKAGAFRPKSYGVEYRTPSNVWLRNAHQIRRMFQSAKKAFDDLINGGQLYNNGVWKKSRHYIDTHATRDIAYSIGGSWNALDWGEKIEPVNMDTLDSLFVQYAKYDKTGLVTKEMLDEAKKLIPKPVRNNRKKKLLVDPVFGLELDPQPVQVDAWADAMREFIEAQPDNVIVDDFEADEAV